MEIWTPANNRVKLNQIAVLNLFDKEFWKLYWKETDPDLRIKLLYSFDNPDVVEYRRML